MKRLLSALVLGLLLLFTLASPLGGCGEEECLQYGEQCGASYKQKYYGRTDIYCCSGNCSTSSVCR